MFFKQFTGDDIYPADKNVLYETIPITGTLVSGTYGTYPNDTNVLKYTSSHGLFESVYDYPHLSSSANHIFDLTFGLRSGGLSPAPVTQSAQKYRIYQEMAQTLLGFDVNGNVKNFSLDGGTTNSDKMLFINLSRLLTKDGVKIGSFTASMGTASWATPFAGTLAQLSDNSTGLTVDNVNIDSPAGQYWYVYTGSAYAVSDRVGVIFYQQGVLALDLGNSIFNSLAYSSSVANPAGGFLSGSNLFSTGTITEISDGFRRYLNNLQFQNSIQINSTIYTCNFGNNEFNYSSNPTYTTGSAIRVKQSPLDNSTTYVTTVGLYDSNQNLTAVAKLSRPLKKTQKDSFIVRVRLDY